MANKKMLINATQSEETRVAIIEDQRLFDLDIESNNKFQKKANIYKAKISRIEPSLNAVFVNYGAEKHGFLPVKEIAPAYFQKPIEFGQQRPDIKALLKEGQELIIQIDKDERGNKGAAVTTYITLAGCYLVLMPNNQGAGGVSRRVEGEEREQLKEILNGLHIPDGMGVIARTAGMGRSKEELQWDLDALLKLWSAIEVAATERPAPFLIYEESDVILRSVRDYMKPEITEIVVDTEVAYNRVLQHVKRLRPDYVNRLRFYQGDVALFTRHQIESQIETAYQREVTLPSGGSIVIDHTEALTSIDINSARATKGGDIEETALQTNLEAAQEIARQLRLRDLGGLVVIDFIDMSSQKSQREVEAQLSSALRADRARVQIGRISQFGLLEMSRQRLRPSLGEATSSVCPRCSGQGKIRSVESLSLSMIRLIKEEAQKPGSTEIQVQLPISIATYLLNEKRSLITEIETQAKVRVTLIPNPHFETPKYELSRVKGGEPVEVQTQASYTLATTPTNSALPYERNTNSHEVPAIKEMPTEAAPITKKPKFGFIQNIIKHFVGKQANDSAVTKSKSTSGNRPAGRGQQNRQGQRRDDRRGSNRNRQQQNRGDNRRDRTEDDHSQDKSQTRPERSQEKRQDRGQDRRQRQGGPRRDGQGSQQRRQNQQAPIATTPVQATPAPVAEALIPKTIVAETRKLQAAEPVSKVSSMVHEVLNKPTALVSALPTHHVESKANSAIPAVISREDVVQKTEFSKEHIKRLDTASHTQLVESKVSTVENRQASNLKVTAEVLGDKK